MASIAALTLSEMGKAENVESEIINPLRSTVLTSDLPGELGKLTGAIRSVSAAI